MAILSYFQPPADRDEIVISDKTILLDTETSRLASLTLGPNGKLIFDPENPAKLVSDYVLIEDEGSLEIGTADCPFVGQAEILLTGERNDEKDIEGFGQKFLGVREGGSLSIHGEDRLSWTRLDAPLAAGQNSLTVQDDVSTWRSGDKIVVTSTEVNWEQAEVFTIGKYLEKFDVAHRTLVSRRPFQRRIFRFFSILRLFNVSTPRPLFRFFHFNNVECGIFQIEFLSMINICGHHWLVFGSFFTKRVSLKNVSNQNKISAQSN